MWGIFWKVLEVSPAIWGIFWKVLEGSPAIWGSKMWVFETNWFSQNKYKTQSNSNHGIQISIVSKTKIGIETQ